MIPVRRTRRVLAGHRLIMKLTDSGFLVGVQLDPTATDDRPMVPPREDLHLIFALRVKDPCFFNYTALAGSTPGFYRFCNDSGNQAAGSRFLSLPVPAFDPARAYAAGEVHAVADADPAVPVDLFSALRDTGPAATPAVGDWQRIPPDTWASAAAYSAGSVVLAANRLYQARHDLPAGSDLTAADQWKPLGALANQYVTSADRRLLQPARFNFDSEAVGAGWFGVIEIGVGSGGMALLDANGALRSPRYTLRFLNRATRWRYIFPAVQEIGTGAEVAPENDTADRVLVTAEPRPLTRCGIGARLQADVPGTADVSEEVLLPLPETHRIRRQSSQWYSEIHMLNLPLGRLSP